MLIKNSFIKDIKKLLSNVQPKIVASGYYHDLEGVEADLIAKYSPFFLDLETYDGLTIPPVTDNSVLEDMKEKLKTSDDITSIIGFCKDVSCPECLACEDCLFSSYNRPTLMRYLGIDHIEPQVEELPKLTVEVFDRPDCPEWANYAVINCNGRLTFFADKPKFEGEDYGCWSCSYSKYKHINNAVFDASDWENSLIERPAKALPDWCKAGKWVYDVSLYEYLYVREEDYDWYVDPVARGRIKQAHKRPFNKAEMKALVGRIFTTVDGDASIATDFDRYLESICICSEWFKNKELADSVWQLDGKPCYKLEHLNEKGEWVE